MAVASERGSSKRCDRSRPHVVQRLERVGQGSFRQQSKADQASEKAEQIGRVIS